MTEFQKINDTDVSHNHINIHDWAIRTLDQDELEQFLEAENRNLALMKSYVQHGLMTQETVKENVYLPEYGEEITIEVGLQTILSPGVTILDVPIDPEYGAWHARYTADPNINHNPTAQV
jgi:hypothetical protein